VQPGGKAGRSPIAFCDLPGWDAAEAEALRDGIRRHLTPAIRSRPHQARWLDAIADRFGGGVCPRRIVEDLFAPLRIDAPGFLTGYYEPVIPASRVRTERYRTPLYRRPPDLVRVHPPDPALPGDGTFARRMPDGGLAPYFDRAEIHAGALDGGGLELAFVEDPVDAFFAQVQGSARLVLPDGEEIRIGYHGKTGHSYTPIGRVMVERGMLPPNDVTMQSIRAGLARHPGSVSSVLEANRSFVFFRERESAGRQAGPIAAGGVPLVPWRSLAVDRSHIALGTPVFVETEVPRHGAHCGVTIAEDTGSAIVGPARGDLFFGSGHDAGELAGAMKAKARLTVMLPRGLGS
jgi:membrane-bound lytic murein transglycosylase A